MLLTHTGAIKTAKPTLKINIFNRFIYYLIAIIIDLI